MGGRRTGSSPLTRGKPFPRAGIPSVNGLIPAHAGKTQAITCPPSRLWAHPRSRGENPLIELDPAAPAGSSPLTRGKPTHGYGG